MPGAAAAAQEDAARPALLPTKPPTRPRPKKPAAGQGAEGVTVYSNCQQVELFLNGQSLGAKPRPADDKDNPRTRTAAAGNLKAVGYNDGKPFATNELHAAGPAAKVALAAYTAASLPHDYDDVSPIQVTITDAAGNPVAARFGSPLHHRRTGRDCGH